MRENKFWNYSITIGNMIVTLVSDLYFGGMNYEETGEGCFGRSGVSWHYRVVLR